MKYNCYKVNENLIYLIIILLFYNFDSTVSIKNISELERNIFDIPGNSETNGSTKASKRKILSQHVKVNPMNPADFDKYFRRVQDDSVKINLLEKMKFKKKNRQQKSGVPTKEPLIFPLSESMIKKVKIRRKNLKSQKRKQYDLKNDYSLHYILASICKNKSSESLQNNYSFKMMCSYTSLASEFESFVDFSTFIKNEYGIDALSIAKRASFNVNSFSTTPFPYFGPPVIQSSLDARDATLQYPGAGNELLDQSSPVNMKLSANFVESFDNRSFTSSALRADNIRPKESMSSVKEDHLSSNENPEEEEKKWPRKVSCQTDGEIILGGLMMIHERDEKMTCGKVMPQGELPQ